MSLVGRNILLQSILYGSGGDVQAPYLWVTCWLLLGAIGVRFKGGLSPRAHSDKTPSKPRPLPILGLLDPRTATDTGATARSFRMRPSAWICVDLTRSKMAGIAMQRPAGARRKSAWRRTIIVEVSQFAPPVTGAITAASRTTETASAAHAARLRRVLAKRHALPTINRRACSARRICHQQAFAGPQHLVGWR